MERSTSDITEEQLKAATGLSWFELNDEGRTRGRLYFETRDHGDVGGEEPSLIDIAEANRMVPLLRQAFPKQAFVADTCDEFVIIVIKDRK